MGPTIQIDWGTLTIQRNYCGHVEDLAGPHTSIRELVVSINDLQRRWKISSVEFGNLIHDVIGHEGQVPPWPITIK